MKPADPVQREREEAWIGDAVLALYSRLYIMDKTSRMDAAMFTAMTSNSFLATIGQPTAIEARIGRCYRDSGLTAAFTLIETELLPRFLLQQANRRRR
jgi:dsRNA-specific ribonuclease